MKLNKKKITSSILIALIVYLAIGFLFALYAWSSELKTFTCVAPEEPHHTLGWGGMWRNPDPERCSRRGFELRTIASLPHLTVGWPIFLGGKIMKTYQGTLAPDGNETTEPIALADGESTYAGVYHESAVEDNLKSFSSLNLKQGDDIFIAGGSGAIGTLAIQIAVYKGFRVFASASKSNHEYMKSLGAEVTVDYHDDNWKEQIREIMPNGVDAAIAIQPGTAEESSHIVKEEGIVITVSGDQVSLERGIILQQIPHMKNVTKELEELFNKVVDGKIKLSLNKYPFAEGIEVLEKVKTRHERGKSVLSMQN